jgi:hypothetical protein
MRGHGWVAGMEPHLRRIAKEATKQGRNEPQEAYAADALVALATSGTKGPRAMVHVNVDHPALVRGHTEEGERCEVPGIGPIPVAVARAMEADCFLKVLLTDGVDVKAVGHHGRTIKATVRTALEARYPTCGIEGCDVGHGLEIDHIYGYAVTKWTALEDLVRLCRPHHSKKSFHGYRLVGDHPSWTLVGPDPP